MVAITFEEMEIPQPPVARSSRLFFRRGRKTRESKGKERMSAPLELTDLARRGDAQAHAHYPPPDYAKMPAGARLLHAANGDSFHLVTLADGCTLRVDASYLPLKPNALDPSGMFHCRCQDDAQAFVAAYLLHWPVFVATALPRAWTLREAQAFSGELLEAWGLDERRLRGDEGPRADAAAAAAAAAPSHRDQLFANWGLGERRLRGARALQTGTVAAVVGALDGGVEGIARRRREWEAQRAEDEKELERRRAEAEASPGPRAKKRGRPTARRGRLAARFGHRGGAARSSRV